MCIYAEAIWHHTACENDPQHQTTFRAYDLCEQPNLEGTPAGYQHCGDAHAQRAEAVFGSTKKGGPCPVCMDSKNATIIVGTLPLACLIELTRCLEVQLMNLNDQTVLI